MSNIKEAGTYPAVLIVPPLPEQWFTESPKKQTDGLVLEFKLQDGSTISTTKWISQNSLPYIEKNMQEVFGLVGKLSNIVKEGSLTNLRCDIVVEMREFSGENGTKYTPEIKYINPRGGNGGGKKTEPTKNLNALLGRLEKMGGSAPVRRNQGPDDWDSGSDGMGSSDIPFMRPHYLTVGGH